ncbi:hypothetical protein quinque_008634 [Culex quinquefasciatus]
MDYNPYHNKLLASGASESKIFIWDLNITAAPMSSRNEGRNRFEDVQSIAWNRQVQHILASVFSSRCRDVLGLTWCPKDFALVASCGKDNNITPKRAKREIAFRARDHQNQWNFDVAWCPRNPALIAGSSFDGNVTVYLINGGAHAQVQTDSRSPSEDLKRPPKWLKRPPGACFGLGCKLDMFNGTSRTVIVNQVVTDCERIERSNRLEQVLAEGTRSDTCVRRNLKDCWETSRLDCDAGDI